MGYSQGGFQLVMGVPLDRSLFMVFIRENANRKKWMITSIGSPK